MLTAHISIPVEGSSMPAYLAHPGTGTPAPAVIVLQEVFGVNANMRRIAELVATAGYVGLAINYYHRKDPHLDAPYTPEGIAKGRETAAHVTRETFRADLGASLDWLNEQDFVRFNHIATWGFCYGGSVAFLSAMERGVSAAVCFYGGQIAKPFISGGPPSIESAGEIRAPLFLAFGGQDKGISPEDVERIAQTLEAKNKRFELKVYPDADHGFFRESSNAFDNADVADAWNRVQSYLKEHLA